jgi:hypothetical protein
MIQSVVHSVHLTKTNIRQHCFQNAIRQTAPILLTISERPEDK